MSKRNLKRVAAFIWYTGGLVLTVKGWRLLLEAYRLNPDLTWPCLAILIGLVGGGLKARFIFSRFCKINLNRIGALAHPSVWQCYRPRFYGFLLLMILAGSTLSHQAQGNYPFLIGVAIVDFSIAVALIGSSYIFWTHKTANL